MTVRSLAETLGSDSMTVSGLAETLGRDKRRVWGGKMERCAGMPSLPASSSGR